MKMSLLIRPGGRQQVILEPESADEEGVLRSMKDGVFTAHYGGWGVYECMGGWSRQRQDSKALMLVRDVPSSTQTFEDTGAPQHVMFMDGSKEEL